MNKKSRIILVSIFLFLSIGYFFWLKPMLAQRKQPLQIIPEVNVAIIKKREIQLSTDLSGRVASYKISEVRPRVSGFIKEKNFTEGDLVKEGQYLYQIDPAVYQAEYNNASASLKAAKARRDRYKDLLSEDAVSKQEFDDVVAAFAKAEADFQRAKKNLSYSKFYAPISGYVGKSNVTEGALVTADQAEPLVTITQLDPIYVDMVQASSDAVSLGDQRGIAVGVTAEGSTEEKIGTLKVSEVFVDEGTDSVRLRALFSNQDHKLLPGMFVRAKLYLKPIEAITIPQRATNRGPNGALMVFVVGADNVVKARIIKAEKAFGDYWIVSDGLESGEIIVLEGFQRIAEGAKVKTIFINDEDDINSAKKVLDKNIIDGEKESTLLKRNEKKN